MLSTEKILFDQIDFLKNEIEYLKNQNEWLREMVSKLTSLNDSPKSEINEEDLVPINRTELPSERKARLTKKYSDLKKSMEQSKES